MRSLRRLWAGLCLAAATLASCAWGAPSGGSPPPPRPPAAPGGPRPLVVAVPGDFPTLDPALADDTASVFAVQLMYQPLFTYQPDGRVVEGLLARSWQWSEDGRVLVVHLDPEARFADGMPVTAGDVAWSLRRMLDPALAAPHAASFAALEGFDAYRRGGAASGDAAADRPLPGIQVVDPYTVAFRLRVPQAFFLHLLALPSASILEKNAVLRAAARDARWWRGASFGSGPYVFKAYRPGQGLDLARSPRYWRQGRTSGRFAEGPFDDVTLRIVGDPAERLRLFAAGQVDVVWPLASREAQLAEARGLGDRLRVGPNDSIAFAGFDVSRPPFDDARVRLAFNEAVDRQELVRVAGGRGQPAYDILPPGLGLDPDPLRYPFDPAQARRLLAAAGYGDGLRVTLSFVSGEADAVAAALRDQLGRVGVRVDLRPEDWSSFYRDLAAGRAPFFQMAFVADYPDPQDYVFNLMNSAAAGRGNPFRYRNPALDALQAEADALIADPARRASLYREMARDVFRDAPWVPEFYGENLALVQPWVEPVDPVLVVHPVLAPQLDRLRLVPTAPRP